MRTWQPDVELDLERCREIVSAQFPQFEILDSEVFGWGWDNICVRYQDGTVFRLPTRAMGGRLIQREIAVLPGLVSKLSVPVPNFRFVGKPNDGYPYGFVGYASLPGTTSDRLSWNSAQRLAVATVLGTFLRDLHGVAITDEIAGVIPSGEVGLSWLTERIDFRFNAIAETLPLQEPWSRTLLNLAQKLISETPEERILVLSHGDLYPRHILADGERTITGVIDWGDVQISHPGTDLSLAYTFFDSPERGAFWESYGKVVSQETKNFAKLKAILYALSLMAYGLDVDDKPITELAEQIARRVSDD